MERIRKGSDLPKKAGVTEHPTKIFAHQVNTKVISSKVISSMSLPFELIVKVPVTPKFPLKG